MTFETLYSYIFLVAFYSWQCVILVTNWWRLQLLQTLNTLNGMLYHINTYQLSIRVITKLPNSEQSYKKKVKTHRYTNRQNKISQPPENCENRNDPDLVQVFLKKWWVESDFKVPNLPLSLRLKVSGCHYNSIYNN